MSAVLGGLIAGAGSLLSGLVNWGANNHLANKKYQADMDMWNKQNVYNLPSAQMQRLKNAGINPNAVVGHGSIVGNTAAQAPQMPAPFAQYGDSVLQGLNAYIDFQNKAAQNSNLVEQNKQLALQNALSIRDLNILKKYYPTTPSFALNNNLSKWDKVPTMLGISPETALGVGAGAWFLKKALPYLGKAANFFIKRHPAGFVGSKFITSPFVKDRFGQAYRYLKK